MSHQPRKLKDNQKIQIISTINEREKNLTLSPSSVKCKRTKVTKIDKTLAKTNSLKKMINKVLIPTINITQ